MKKVFIVLTTIVVYTLTSCSSGEQNNNAASNTNTEATANAVGQSGVEDSQSAKDIVKTAAGSKDHTTLVAAVKAAGLLDALSNAGPFTVFAPTNAAFDKLPAGTVDNLLKPENKGKLEDALGYHTYVGSIKAENMQDGQQLNMVFGGNVTITKKDGKTFVNGSEILASIPTSNGIIHVIGDVLSPPAK